MTDQPRCAECGRELGDFAHPGCPACELPAGVMGPPEHRADCDFCDGKGLCPMCAARWEAKTLGALQASPVQPSDDDLVFSPGPDGMCVRCHAPLGLHEAETNACGTQPAPSDDEAGRAGLGDNRCLDGRVQACLLPTGHEGPHTGEPSDDSKAGQQRWAEAWRNNSNVHDPADDSQPSGIGGGEEIETEQCPHITTSPPSGNRLRCDLESGHRGRHLYVYATPLPPASQEEERDEKLWGECEAILDVLRQPRTPENMVGILHDWIRIDRQLIHDDYATDDRPAKLETTEAGREEAGRSWQLGDDPLPRPPLGPLQRPASLPAVVPDGERLTPAGPAQLGARVTAQGALDCWDEGGPDAARGYLERMADPDAS